MDSLHEITNVPDSNGDFLFVKDNISFAHLGNQNINIAKTVYAYFNNDGRKDLDINDPSWDVIHIDNDFTNNNITNLKYIDK